MRVCEMRARRVRGPCPVTSKNPTWVPSPWPPGPLFWGPLAEPPKGIPALTAFNAGWSLFDLLPAVAARRGLMRGALQPNGATSARPITSTEVLGRAVY